MNPQVAQPCPCTDSDESAEVRRTISKLRQHVELHEWAGYDPYDALNSRLLQRLRVFNLGVLRLACTQLLKRCPVNLRPCLGIAREQNPKGIAVFLSAYVRLCRLGLVGNTPVRHLAERLIELRTKGQRHVCWGYNFAWQTRTYLVPRGMPNIICTTFAGNSLLDACELLGEEKCLEAARSAGRFVLEGLNRTAEADTFCFSYTPLDRSRVHNANFLGASLLARLNKLEPESSFEQASRTATCYGLKHQGPDGSWPYGEGPKQQWIDSFHTGYNLCALEGIRECMGWEELRGPIERGYRFYLDHFFEPDGRVKYFHDRTYPIDSHAIAHALVTLTTLASYDPRSLPVAAKMCDWALRNMRSPEGWFYYQKWPLWTNRINYMRWSQAWMLLGLAEYAKKLAGV